MSLISNKNKIQKRIVLLLSLFIVSTLLLTVLVIQQTFFSSNHSKTPDQIEAVSSPDSPIKSSDSEFSAPDTEQSIKIQYPCLAIVIDDFGNQWNTAPVQGLLELDIPLTVAILPGLWASDSVSSKANRLEKEIIVHLPMEAVNHDYDMEKRFVKEKMSEIETIAFLDEVCQVNNAVGINNHMGSLATQNSILMGYIADWCMKRGWFLFDSITHPSSVLYEVAVTVGIPTIERDIFLDHSSEPDLIRKALYNAVSISERKRRIVVVIGHPRNTTWLVLEKEIPELKSSGVQFVKLSQAIENR